MDVARSKLRSERLFLTDGGLETDMIFNRGLALPSFSSVMLLRGHAGREALTGYYREYLELARAADTGFILESATWRASPDWTAELGISVDELERLNRDAISLLRDLRTKFESDSLPIVVSGCLGPRGDGYDPGKIMSGNEAHDYHGWQAAILADAGVDRLTAITMTNVNEAIGIIRAARDLDQPVVISFTVETDGRLPTGYSLQGAIEEADSATNGYAAYFMVNCAHPSHFAPALMEHGAWVDRVRGLRANASRCSHSELEAMTELDSGDPVELGNEYRALIDRLPQINVLGGCCGTDLRHVRAIAEACLEIA